MLCIAQILIFMASAASATDDENRLSNIVDAAGMFNERGYSKSNSFSLTGNEVINDFNGNLMYTQRLRYLPLSENGLQADLKLVYNGNVSHTAFGARSGMNNLVQTPVNLPEWIISLNGIAIQTFNFENELISWQSNLYGDTLSYDDDVAAHIEGYQNCYRFRHGSTGYDHGVISILMEDGSVKELYCRSTGSYGPANMVAGEYNTCSKDDADRGFLFPLSSEMHGYFKLFRSDGTQVLFQILIPQYFTCQESYSSSQIDYPRILLPVKFSDQMGHEINLIYSSQVDTMEVYGRPLIESAGDFEFNFEDWGGIHSNQNELRISCLGSSEYYIAFASQPPEPGLIPGIPVSLGTGPNRGQVCSINFYNTRITNFKYRTYSRFFKNLRMGLNPIQHQFFDCETEDYRYAGRAYKVEPWRIWSITYPEGGNTFFQYFEDLSTAWGQQAFLGPKDTISINYDHSQNCLDGALPKFPCRKSQKFDEIGRDPFFLNIVAAARRTLDESQVVNTDTLIFLWDDSQGDQVIDSDDLFITERWFGKDNLDDWESDQQVKNRRIVYRYFPEQGPFSKASRDRGWAMKMMSSREEEKWSGGEVILKDYYWDINCDEFLCLGTFLLDSLRTTHNNESYVETDTYYWLGDPASETTNNITRKRHLDPWGIFTYTDFDTSYMRLHDPSNTYYNSSLKTRVMQVSYPEPTISLETFQYFDALSTDGYVGQLKKSVKYLIDTQGSLTDSTVDQFLYLKESAPALQYRGATRRHIDPMGNETDYDYPEPSAEIMFKLQAYDGSVEYCLEEINFTDAGPYWTLLSKTVGSKTLLWHRKVDRKGNLLLSIEPNRYRSDISYDGLDRVFTVILPGGYRPGDKEVLPPGPQDTAWSILYWYDDDFDPDPLYVSQRIRVDKNLPSQLSKSWFDGFSRAFRHETFNADGSYDSTLTEFDYAGRAISQLDQLGYTTHSSYDHLDRQTGTRYPDPNHSGDSAIYTVTNAQALGLTARFGFPETIIFGKEFRDENNHVVLEYYDVRNKLRLKRTYDGVTPLSTYFDYDNLGNLTKVIRPNGDSVMYTYNSLGQLTREVSPDMIAPIDYKYDKNGNLIRAKDANCQIYNPPRELYYSYDNLDRIIEYGVDVDLFGTHYYMPLKRYFYDQAGSELSLGRLSMVFTTDQNNICNYAERYHYDPRGRVKRQVNYFNAVLDSTYDSQSGFWVHDVTGDSVELRYTYDWADQLTSITYPDGSKVDYEYDNRGRLVAVGDPQGGAAEYAQLEYNQRDQVKLLTLGDALQKVDYAYNERGWLESINEGTSQGAAPGDLFGQELYYYSHPYGFSEWGPQFNGNLFGQKISVQGSPHYYAYRYDESDRLRESNFDAFPFESLAYDANGNITQLTKMISGGSVTKDYRYIAGTNKLRVADRTHWLADDSLYYDPNGNVVRHSGKKTSAYYDVTNQMSMIKIIGAYGEDTVWYGYNASGERIYKSYIYRYRGSCDETKGQDKGNPPPGGDTTWLFCIKRAVQNTYYVLGQGKVLQELSSVSPFDSKAKFIYAGGNRIAMRDQDERLHYFLNDHLGSTRVVLDSAGTVKDLHQYYSFGETLFEQTSTNQSYKYTSKPLDKESGVNLYYYGARYYDPELGRFWAIDPAANKYPSLSPYAYCANNPLRNVDPDGGTFEDCVWGAIGAISDNALGGGTPIRGLITPTSVSDQKLGQKFGDAISMVGGALEIVVGVLGLIAEGGATVSTGGAIAPASVPAAVATAGLVTHGAVMMTSGAKNLVSSEADKSPAEVRSEFNNKTRPQYWKEEAAKNPGGYSKENVERMKQGKAPLGADGKPVELHHKDQVTKGGQNDKNNLNPMSPQEHRYGDNYRKNHPKD